MNWIERARYLRQMIERMAEEILEDETALEYKELFPEWQDGTDYHVGDRVRHEGTLYKCLIAHTAQADWMPNAAVSLWAVVLIPDQDEILEWVQPDSTNPYMRGDRVRHNGKVWESDYDNNVWEPGVFGWHEMTD